jgi:hypothetical protein
MRRSADVAAILPGLGQLRGYRREWLAKDLVALGASNVVAETVPRMG